MKGFLAGVVTTLLAGAFWYFLAGHDPTPEDADGTTSARAREDTGPTQPEHQANRDMPALIRAATAVAAEKITAEGLDDYLDSLVEHARRNGRVTALEVEPGLKMIEQHGNDPEVIGAFMQRMKDLQRDLSSSPNTEQISDAERRAQLDELASAIEAETHADERQQIIREYLELARGLPEEEQTDAIRRFKRMAPEAGDATEAQSIDELWNAVQDANEGELRQRAIQSFLERVRELPEQDQVDWIRRLREQSTPQQ